MICIELVAWRSTNQFFTEKVYRQILCNEYNISFHRPRNQYKQKEESGNIDESTKQEHQRRKLQESKGEQNKTFSAATFDLEAVLPTPCSKVSQAYYKRKRSCYNLSLHSLGDNKGTCFLWNETEGQRGSCEVATFLHKYIYCRLMHQAILFANLIGAPRSCTLTDTRPHASSAVPFAVM